MVSFAAFISTLCAVSCVEVESLEISETDAPYINGIQTVVAEACGGEHTVSITCSTEWSISMIGDVDWVNVTPECGKNDAVIVFSFEPNDYLEERRASFRFTASGGTEVLLIAVQKPEDAILLSSTIQEVPVDGTFFDIYVESNIDYEFNIDVDWIHLAGTSPSSEATVLSFEVLPYEEYSHREGHIIFSGKDVTETVTVYQNFNEEFILSKDEFLVSDRGETIAIDISSNIEFTVESIDADWVHDISTKAMSTHTKYFSIDPNTEYENREAHIIFRSIKGTEEQVTIIQVQKDAIILAKDFIDLESEQQRVGIVVNTNMDDISAEVDEASGHWLSIVGNTDTKALTERTIYVDVNENDTGDMRTGYITISAGDKSETVTIRQQSSNMFYLLYYEKLIDFAGGEITVDFVRNTDYTCTIEESAAGWLHEKLSTKTALINDSKKFIVDRNDTDDYRSGKIIFSYADGKSETLTVTQLPEGKIVLAKKQYVLTGARNILQVDILTNQDVEAIIPENCDWISPVQTKALAGKVIMLRCSDNNEDIVRRADIDIVTADGSASQTICIIQSSIAYLGYMEQDLRSSLVSLYKATDGDNWTNNTNWCSDKPIDEWYGIVANKFSLDASGNFKGYYRLDINLSNNNLNGEIPDEFCDISVIMDLDINDNNITSLPDRISEMPIVSFNIRNTKITSLPDRLFDNPFLMYFRVSGSPVTNFPLVDTNNESLIEIEFEDCKLKEFPAGLGRLKNLKRAVFSGNVNMTGKLPENIWQLDSLRTLDVSRCKLSGEIPENISELKNIEYLFLNDNLFEGEIPESLGKLVQCKIFLNNNELSGTIHPALSELKDFYCQRNRLDIGLDQEESTLPEEILNSPTYSSWSVYPQRINSEQAAAEKKALEDLYMTFNGSSWKNSSGWLTDAPVGEWYGVAVNKYDAVVGIDLYNNNTDGELPASLGNLKYLERFYVDGINGQIPAEVAIRDWWKSKWTEIYYNNMSDFANSSNMKVGMTDFSIKDVSGNTVTYDEISSKCDYILVALINPFFPYCFYDLSSLKNTFGNRIAIIVSDMNRSLMSDTSLSSAEYLSRIMDNTGIDMYYVAQEELVSGLPEFSSKYYIRQISDNQRTTHSGIITEWNSDFLSLFDAKTGISLWHGSSYIAWGGGSSYIEVPADDIAQIIAGESIPIVPYESVDYSRDGEVRTIQKAAEGKGINVVVMGDAFTDREIASGTYDKYIDIAVEAIFDEEPYKTYRNRFNIYAVTAVSKNNVYAPKTDGASDTVFGMYFNYGGATHCGGTDSKVFEYAMKVPDIDEGNINETLCIVIGNTPYDAGTTFFYADGSAVAYQGIPGYSYDKLAGVVKHEAAGHGFGKLADEYIQSTGSIPPSEAAEITNAYEQYGWYANVDFTNDPSEIRWSNFLLDSRYKNLVGIYEGGALYGKGVFRPTETSIMKYNTGEFNAPSREAIFKRIMELSGEEYTWEKFIDYDAVNRQKSVAISALSKSKKSETVNIHGAAPVFAGKTWRESF